MVIFLVFVSCVAISNPDLVYPAVEQKFILEEAAKSTCLNGLDVGQPFVVSISQRNEELRFHNVVYYLTISNRSFKKPVSSNASRG
jgi:hypothetical protein